MKQTLFIFGRTPGLSLAELTSFYPEATLLRPDIAVISGTIENPQDIIHTLGGTVKIVETMGDVEELSEDSLLPILLSEARDNHITFGLSAYGTRMPDKLSSLVKKQLTLRGLVARYVETKHDEALSSVVIAKQQVVELVAIPQGQHFLVGITRAVQDFEDWNKRDFGRPAADPKAGMLPPKVARMIVNIALRGADAGHHPMVVDPFCGVGTVLAEALLVGANVSGSDISETAIAHAKKNIEWLRREYPIIAHMYANIFVGDATHLSKYMAVDSADVIVTEPFMGENLDKKDLANLRPERVKNILRGLEKLYIGALKEWTHVLKTNGTIVMAMPAYDMGRAVMRVKNVVDRCESLGYTLFTGPIEYSRPQAVVRREFYVFKKK